MVNLLEMDTVGLGGEERERFKTREGTCDQMVCADEIGFLRHG